VELQGIQEIAIASRGVDTDNFSTMAESIIKKMHLFKNYSLPEWGAYTLTIEEKLKALIHSHKSSSHSPQLRLDMIREIVKNFVTLRRHSVLYENLKDGSSLSRGLGFRGTRHCEVCIASLVGKPGPTEYKELLSGFSVSHIFMLCLDVCQNFQYRNVHLL
jgi:hypothetical protein